MADEVKIRVLRMLAGREPIRRPWRRDIECRAFRQLVRSGHVERVRAERTVGGETFPVHEWRPSAKVRFG